VNFQNIVAKIGLLVAAAVLSFAPLAHAQIYINDSTLSNFTGPITSYATLSNFASGDVSAPYTPTASSVASGLRVYNGTLSGNGLYPGNNWIKATFPSPVSTIVVFPSIDHLGASFDGYQYSIAGSNDGVNWTMLYDTLTVNGTAEPFTLGTYSGTAGPLIVNNVVTPGTGPSGTVGYEAFFDFGRAYKYYAFGASAIAIAQGNADHELSAVGTGPAAITHPLLGNASPTTFDFGFAKYVVVYPPNFTIPANTSMTIYANELSSGDCASAINILKFAGDEPRCTTFTNTVPGNFSVIFDVACSVSGAPSTSGQCPETGGYDPLATPPKPHSSLDISNILTYASTDNLTGYAPQMLTAHEGNNDWVTFGVGFQSDCCTRGSGTSSYNSLTVSADFPTSTNSPSAFAIPPFTFYGFQPPVGMSPTVNVANAGSIIPLKWQLLYPVNANLGFNGGPVTNLNFPPLGYLGLAVTKVCNSSAYAAVDETIPVETETNTGLMNLGGGFYQYNWQTPNVFGGHSLAGQCLVVTAGMGDNINYNVNILFH
jgi:hypothetical protein